MITSYETKCGLVNSSEYENLLGLKSSLTGDGVLGQVINPSLDLLFSENIVSPLITFTRASGGMRVKPDNTLEWLGTNVPRLSYAVVAGKTGLLVEEARTNSIRNNTMVGAVAGTPGTLPTNWSVSTLPAGITGSVASVGVESGVSYIDYRLSGTAGASGVLQLRFEAITAIAALTAQAWSQSVYLTRVAGSTSGLSSWLFSLSEYTAASGYVRESLSTLSAPSVTELPLAWYNAAFTTSGGATVAFVRPSFQVAIANGAAIDITLRIGMPQLEQGAFATSPIPTTTTAATRAADIPKIAGVNFSSWYRQDEGTFVVEGSKYAGISGATSVAQADDTTVNNRVVVGIGASGIADQSTLAVITGATQQVALNTTFAASNKVAAAYATNNFAVSVNGAVVTTDVSGALPTVVQMRFGSNGNTYLNGHIFRLTYYPTRVSNTQLQALSAF